MRCTVGTDEHLVIADTVTPLELGETCCLLRWRLRSVFVASFWKGCHSL
jgi:hypothetical protein